MKKTDNIYDVVVIGAGLSGLTAAYQLQNLNYNVIVLEAKSRIGGRLFSQKIPGGVVDAGGSWVGPQQTALLALLRELHISTWPQYTKGKHVLIWNNKRKTFTGEIPPLSLFSYIDIAVTMMRLNRMAKQLIGIEAWKHKNAHTLDHQTLGEWLIQHTHTKGARFLFDLATAASFGCKSDELSLLGFLVHVASAGNLQTLIGVKGAALDGHIVGGSASLCQILADKMINKIHCNTAVTEINQTDIDVTIKTTDGIFTAKKIILAMDPVLASKIDHKPSLPPERTALEQNYRMGNGIKAHVVYSTPFWRKKNLSGESYVNTGLVPITFDVTPPNTTVGILTCFMGQAACDDPKYFETNYREKRKQRVIQELVERFGHEAASPIEYLEQDWSQERYHSGCLPMPGPGVLTTAQDSFTKPFGNIHFAGAETSPIWEGHMDGAVRSAERVVKEVKKELDN